MIAEFTTPNVSLTPYVLWNYSNHFARIFLLFFFTVCLHPCHGTTVLHNYAFLYFVSTSISPIRIARTTLRMYFCILYICPQTFNRTTQTIFLHRPTSASILRVYHHAPYENTQTTWRLPFCSLYTQFVVVVVVFGYKPFCILHILYSLSCQLEKKSPGKFWRFVGGTDSRRRISLYPTLFRFLPNCATTGPFTCRGFFYLRMPAVWLWDLGFPSLPNDYSQRSPFPKIR